MVRQMLKMITRRKTTTMTTEMRTSERMAKMMRMKRNHLRMKQILWMKILINYMIRWKREEILSEKSGLHHSSCFPMRKHFHRRWPSQRRWKVPRKKSWMLVRYPIVEVDLCLHSPPIMHLTYLKQDMLTQETLTGQTPAQWNKKETIAFMVSLKLVKCKLKT